MVGHRFNVFQRVSHLEKNPLKVSDVTFQVRYQGMCQLPDPALLNPLDIPVVDLERDEYSDDYQDDFTYGKCQVLACL
jgi:hypothetical protein